MKGFRVARHGGPEALEWGEWADPVPGPGEVTVRVRACALNHLDLWLRNGVPGHRFPLPLVPGSEVAGDVAATGAGVTDLAEATPCLVASGVSCGVCARCLAGLDHLCPRYGLLGEHRDGGYAEYVTVPRRNILPIPPGLSYVEAAAIPLGFLTAWHMLTARAGLKAHEDILLHAAGSGVTSAGIQIARLLGARRILVTAGSEAKLARARGLGATHGILYNQGDFVRAAREATQGEGVDVVFDHVGGETFERSLKLLKRGGRIVLCGATCRARRPDQPAGALLQAALGARLDDGQPGRAREPPALLRVGRPAAGRRPYLPARRGAGGAGVPRPARRLRQARAHRRHGRQGRTASAPCAGGPTVTSHEFVAGLVAEMQTVFARLGAREALEAESRGQVEIVPLLKAALRSEVEAAELGGFCLPTTPELDAKSAFAQQCGDEMKHYRLIVARLAELGVDVSQEDPLAEGYSPLYHYVKGLKSTVERIAAGPFAREAIARVRNEQFIELCEQLGDNGTARLYRDVIQPEEIHHHELGRKVLERLCTTPELQRLAAQAARNTLAIADELSTLAERSTGMHSIPVS